MKKLFLAMLIGAVALVSCSKDDSGNDNGDPLGRSCRAVRTVQTRLLAASSP